MIDTDLFYIRSNCYRTTWSNYISAVNKNNKSNSNFLAVWPRRFLNKRYATITCNYLIDLLAIINAWKYWHGDTGCSIMGTVGDEFTIKCSCSNTSLQSNFEISHRRYRLYDTIALKTFKVFIKRETIVMWTVFLRYPASVDVHHIEETNKP